MFYEKVIHSTILKFYYLIKPLLPRTLQVFMRRIIVKRQRIKYSNVWPINEKTAVPPDGWQGWPENKKFALVLTHDVEDQRGYKRVEKLLELEKKQGFKSSFNFVPKRYTVTHELRTFLRENGFEIGVHGLYHDGKLYNNQQRYQHRGIEINKYLQEWGAVGFRAPSMHQNLDWNCYLNIEYDLSSFDTDPFEPQSAGTGTIFPEIFQNCALRQDCQLDCNGYVEMPYTLPQDYTTFILMQEKGIDIWKQKIDWVAVKGGMVLLNTHPDYMCFGVINGKLMSILRNIICNSFTT